MANRMLAWLRKLFAWVASRSLCRNVVVGSRDGTRPSWNGVPGEALLPEQQIQGIRLYLSISMLMAFYPMEHQQQTHFASCRARWSRTPRGDIAVETLKCGDGVTTTDGVAKPASWIGLQTVSTRFADPLRVLPIRIKVGHSATMCRPATCCFRPITQFSLAAYLYRLARW
jgi:hypothetical protein